MRRIAYLGEVWWFLMFFSQWFEFLIIIFGAQESNFVNWEASLSLVYVTQKRAPLDWYKGINLNTKQLLGTPLNMFCKMNIFLWLCLFTPLFVSLDIRKKIETKYKVDWKHVSYVFLQQYSLGRFYKRIRASRYKLTMLLVINEWENKQ